jgi:hypothetical protein
MSAGAAPAPGPLGQRSSPTGGERAPFGLGPAAFLQASSMRLGCCSLVPEVPNIANIARRIA